MVPLSGTWTVTKRNNKKVQFELPGTIDGSGNGDGITKDTVWYSGLYNPFFYEREEYKAGAGEDFLVPFLSQPKTRYIGKACYQREFETEKEDTWYFYAEVSKWRLYVLIDGQAVGSDESLCAPFLIGPVFLAPGTHKITVIVDNSFLYPYRPDSHGISDCLNASWNGMAGTIGLISASEKMFMERDRRDYAKEHPVSVKVNGLNICVNGKDEYFRGTHFGGGFYDTLYPHTDKEYWTKLMLVIKEWGFNFIRFHSFCPPEAAFLAADETGVYLQVECGMWNDFNPEDEEMFGLLMKETRKILEWFGHHPSFILMSPSNEPGGNWYGPLRRWVSLAKEINRELGYEGRRLFTAQSGWFYDTEPSKTTGTDYLYFHRSAFGPVHGGMIRNSWGWRGKDYSPSLEGSRLPVISHEMGQWCAYPDFDVIDKFKGAVRPGNYEIFRENARENGVLELNKDFVFCSGKNQVRLLKEEFEANYRTKELCGYEYLDIHDYTGQGTAVVGVLDPFFENKGYTHPGEFRQFNSEIVILPRLKTYVYNDTETIECPVEIANYSGEDLTGVIVAWKLKPVSGVYGNAECDVDMSAGRIPAGCNTNIGTVDFDLSCFTRSCRARLTAQLAAGGRVYSRNSWDITILSKKDTTPEPEKETALFERTGLVVARTAKDAKEALEQGKTVFLNPWASDMDFECPPLSMKNVFWNAQMGPRWSRPLGISVDTENQLFSDFPTDRAGGYEWEDILDRSRGFNLPARYRTIVRAVDDWNRNYPLAVIFEGKVLNGKLLFCSADVSSDLEKRPAATALRRALLLYAASSHFAPKQTIAWEDIEEHLRPLYKSLDAFKSVSVAGVEPDEYLKRSLTDLTDINPNIPFRMKPESLPVTFKFELVEPVKIKKVFSLPIQTDRDFPGIIKEYSVKVNGKEFKGEWKSSFRTQWTDEINETAQSFEFTVLSTYSTGVAARWVDEADGYHRYEKEEPLCITAASFGIEFEDGAGNIRHSDSPFWREEAAKRHKEIDL